MGLIENFLRSAERLQTKKTYRTEALRRGPLAQIGRQREVLLNFASTLASSRDRSPELRASNLLHLRERFAQDSLGTEAALYVPLESEFTDHIQSARKARRTIETELAALSDMEPAGDRFLEAMSHVVDAVRSLLRTEASEFLLYAPNYLDNESYDALDKRYLAHSERR